MTHLSEAPVRATGIGLLQPGCVARLRAAGSHRPQPAARRAVHPARPAHGPTAPPPARTADTGTAPKSTQRVGSEARYVRRWLQPRLPDLCDAVLRSALGGDMEATRLLLRMGGLDGKPETPKKKPTKTGPGFAKKAMDEFRAR